MKILRDPQIITGFIYEEPVDEIPALTHCGEALCCRGHARPPHVHSGFEFLYLLRGTCHWQATGRDFCQRMGDMFIAHPGVAHKTGPAPNPENQHLWVGLGLSELGSRGLHLSRQIRRQKVWLLAGFYEAELLLRALIGQVVVKQPHRATVIASLLTAFIETVAQKIDASKRSTKALETTTWPYSFAIQKAVAYMQRNLDRRISLRDMSSLASMRNPAHFCTLFRQEVGQTPAIYHQHLRLQAAKEALHQPSVEITDIAYQFGFSSSQHFSTQFHRLFGITPRQWKIGGRLPGSGSGLK